MQVRIALDRETYTVGWNCPKCDKITRCSFVGKSGVRIRSPHMYSMYSMYLYMCWITGSSGGLYSMMPLSKVGLLRLSQMGR